MSYRKFIPILCVVLISVFSIHAESGITILATNSWTAAFAKMAGVDSAGMIIQQLAPADMEHPPEYELKPSDVKIIRDADLLIYAGYEVLMKTVFESFNKPDHQLVKIMTSYAPAMLEQSVLAIAEKIGTVAEAQRNIAAYKLQMAEARERLKSAGLFGVPVLVQFHQKPLAVALGFDVLGVFGPQPLEVRQIVEFGKTAPRLIIDNAHNPMAAPLEEILGMQAVELINFPGFSVDSNAVPMTLPEVTACNLEKLLGQ